ncbi:uncharacterized protein METZ01_LOCUS411025, partial [marine metagenome]
TLLNVILKSLPSKTYPVIPNRQKKKDIRRLDAFFLQLQMLEQ